MRVERDVKVYLTQDEKESLHSTIALLRDIFDELDAEEECFNTVQAAIYDLEDLRDNWIVKEE